MFVVCLGNLTSCDSILLLLVLLGSLELVLVEEVDQVLLAGLQSHLARKLVHAQLLDDLEDVCLTTQLGARVLKEPLFAALFLATAAQAARASFFEPPLPPVAIFEFFSIDDRVI